MPQSLISKVLVVFVSLLLACLAIVLGLRLAGQTNHQTVLGQVSVNFKPSSSGTLEAYVPLADWGVRAHPFTAPVTIRLEPRGLDRQALLDMAGQPTPLLSAAERDLRSAIISSALWSLLWIILAAFLLAMPLFLLIRLLALSYYWLSLPIIITLIMSVTVALVAKESFSTARLEKVSYWARGGELPELLRFASQREQASQAYRSSVERGLGEFAGALSGRSIGRRGRQALALSDLHNNVLVMPAIKKLADGDPVFLVGDLTHEGGPVEQRNMLRAVRSLGRPLAVVSGNHDSQQLMRRLASAGAVVLTARGRLLPDGRYSPRPVYISGMKVVGFADPDQGRFNQVSRLDQAQRGRVVERWRTIVEQSRPDLVMVHDSGLAANLAAGLRDRRLVILTGHNHYQEVSRYGRVIVVNAGSAGAGGLFGLGREQVGFARLYLEPPTISAVDLIRQEPFSGDGQAERILLGSGDSCRPSGAACVYYRQRNKS